MSSSVATFLETPYVIAASIPGPLHLQRGIECQDRISCRFSNGLVAIAVSDGLGSAPLADVGAEVAVRAAVGALANETPFEELAREMALASRAGLELEATTREVKVSSLACTLIAVVTDGYRLNVAHLGDGAVVAEMVDGLVLASPPAESEYANEVDHLASDSWAEDLRFSGDLLGVSALAVFSDGCQRACLSRSEGLFRPHPGFFEPLFAWAREAPDVLASSEELRRVLAGDKLSEHSEDDKTFALAIIGGDGSL